MYCNILLTGSKVKNIFPLVLKQTTKDKNSSYKEAVETSTTPLNVSYENQSAFDELRIFADLYVTGFEIVKGTASSVDMFRLSFRNGEIRLGDFLSTLEESAKETKKQTIELIAIVIKDRQHLSFYYIINQRKDNNRMMLVTSSYYRNYLLYFLYSFIIIAIVIAIKIKTIRQSQLEISS